ncbi:RAMP superfamily CRISPR-associated protein [Streptomyces tubercidicus]
MRVTITFHGPFRVATGTGRPGVQATVDENDLLPASTLKGIMRDSAERLLPGAPGLVTAVFGGRRQPTPWAWEGARFPNEAPVVRMRAQVSLNEETGAAKRDHLLLGEDVWARSAVFDIVQYGPLPHARLPGSSGSGRPPLSRDDHLTVLACAAAGVHSLGAGRRRGLGWVRCEPADPAVDDGLLAHFAALAAREREDRRA